MKLDMSSAIWFQLRELWLKRYHIHWKCDYWSLGWGWGGMWRSIQTTCQRILSLISQKPNVISGKITYCKIILYTCTYHYYWHRRFYLDFCHVCFIPLWIQIFLSLFPSVDSFISFWITNNTTFVLRFYGVIFKTESTNIC